MAARPERLTNGWAVSRECSSKICQRSSFYTALSHHGCNISHHALDRLTDVHKYQIANGRCGYILMTQVFHEMENGSLSYLRIIISLSAQVQTLPPIAPLDPGFRQLHRGERPNLQVLANQAVLVDFRGS